MKPNRFSAKVIAIQDKGQRVMEVTFEKHETHYDCARCKTNQKIPAVSRQFGDAWSSCGKCGQVGVFVCTN